MPSRLNATMRPGDRAGGRGRPSRNGRAGSATSAAGSCRPGCRWPAYGHRPERDRHRGAGAAGQQQPGRIGAREIGDIPQPNRKVNVHPLIALLALCELRLLSLKAGSQPVQNLLQAVNVTLFDQFLVKRPWHHSIPRSENARIGTLCDRSF